MAKRVSIVLAACNGEKYISAQIASILRQLGENDELIVTLDPSTDQTESIVTGFHDPRIRLLQGPGRGVIGNVENGLTAASGDYILLGDQDDIWLPGKLSKVLTALEQDGILLVLHDCQIVDENLNVLQPSYFSWHGTKTGFWNNVIRNSFIGCCMGFRRSLLERALPFPSQLPMHDQWLGLVACASGKVSYLEEPLLDYRRHGDNQSSLHHASLKQMIAWRLCVIRALKKRGLL